MGCLLLLFGCQSEILIAQQTVRRFVFFDLREAATIWSWSALGSDLPAFQSWQTVGVRPMRRAMDALVTPVSRISASNLL